MNTPAKNVQGRALALAGLVQASTLCLSIAKSGLASSDATEACRGSLFKFDANSVFDIYQNGDLLTLGKKNLARLLSGPSESDRALISVSGQILRLSRRLKASDPAQYQLKAGLFAIIEDTQHVAEQATRFSIIDQRCAVLYQQHISPLAQRIVIHGSQEHLSRSENTDRIRTLLLAGTRAGFLFYQLGGSRWQLIFQRQQIRHQLNFI